MTRAAKTYRNHSHPNLSDVNMSTRTRYRTRISTSNVDEDQKCKYLAVATTRPHRYHQQETASAELQGR